MTKNFLLVLNATDQNRYNCVKYARSKVPSLPFGLWTIFDKMKIQNSTKAQIGNVAIMRVGLPWGHVGVVVGKGSDRIVIQEANYKFGKITERQGTENDLKIIGYYNPNK